MKEFLDNYTKLSEGIKKEWFSDKEREIIEGMLFFQRLYSDKELYKMVESTLSKEVYKYYNK